MSIFIYILKVSLALVFFYTLYRLLFSRFTFFKFNRFYLLFVSLVSFLLPFINFPIRTGNFVFQDYSIGIDWEQIMNMGVVGEQAESSAPVVQPVNIILLIYGLISLVSLLYGIRQYIRVRRSYSDGFILKRNGIRLIVHPDIQTPFTMFRTVYLDRQTFEQDNTAVIRHEMVHARELHSFDLLISEIICACLWFNPFVFLFKRQMRENHEFLADHAAYADDQGLIVYMQALSSELTRKYDPAYASYFKSSTLKKRIIMLTNRKSQKNKKWLYLIMIPAIGFMTLAFQQPVDEVIGSAGLSRPEAQGNNAVGLATSSDIPSRFPLDDKFRTEVTLNFGWEGKNPITGEMMTHKGIDMRAPKGTPVYATADGVVAKSTFHEGYGKFVVIKHADSYASLYGHLDELQVEEGEQIEIGQQLGTVGSTGKSTGPHLHYEVRKAGENVNPADYY